MRRLIFLFHALALVVPQIGHGQAPVLIDQIPAVIGTTGALGRAEAKGNSFGAVETPKGMSAIFVYRKSQFSVNVIPVYLNGKVFTYLQTGAFEVAFVGPGKHEIVFPESLPPLAASEYEKQIKNTRPKKLVLNTSADTTVFVEGETRRGIGQPNWDDIFIYFKEQPREEALPEIEKTRRSRSTPHTSPAKLWTPPAE